MHVLSSAPRYSDNNPYYSGCQVLPSDMGTSNITIRITFPWSFIKTKQRENLFSLEFAFFLFYHIACALDLVLVVMSILMPHTSLHAFHCFVLCSCAYMSLERTRFSIERPQSSNFF